jgi:GNAT superfamily N-acetyltransferase
MKWPTTDQLREMIPLPAGYGFIEMSRDNIAPLIQGLASWHPEIRVGVSSCYLREDFYLTRVALSDGRDADIMVIPILYRGEMVGMWSFEREEDSLAIYGRLIVLAPAHRGAGIAALAMQGTELIGRHMGAAFMYALATLQHPYAQRALEGAGYRLLGLFPGYDRVEVSPGVVKRVYQAVYAKLLVPASEVHWPDRANMSPTAKALYELLFADAA